MRSSEASPTRSGARDGEPRQLLSLLSRAWGRAVFPQTSQCYVFFVSKEQKDWGPWLGPLMAEAKRFTPKTGARLCGNDDFEEPGFQVYDIGDYATLEEAKAAMEEWKKRPDYNGDRLFIYLPVPSLTDD